MAVDYKPCFIIPCYNHSSTLEPILKVLTADHHLEGFIVDDGSSEEHAQAILKTANAFTGVQVIQHEINLGKGGAVQTGLRTAINNGFTHAYQVDADGQHDLQKLKALIETSRNHPNSLISGQPQYAEDVPKSRLWGRYITHFWVWIETLSFKIKDSMCGFRAYPLAETSQVLDKFLLGNKMDFDIEIMVKSHWQGVDIRFLPVNVIYPEDGISHFDVLWDNVRISWMHTKLVIGMILRSPLLLFRGLRR